ncbi:uncharacterized protein LOC113357003 [Papaver somniferum]|uniref:uncharacterized protein LOC113357003 n=1 Tax=Papaver somniferum TaxID=3469 RepID=UPI000E6FDD23|nr:uncharacterized protein LOC113357003 [Papaver somniferum]XP_026456040.1 uncharacterized protein LOC113357003 [Papaver somniferum]
MAAFSANIICQTKTFIPSSPILKFRNPKFVSKSAYIRSYYLHNQIHRNSVSMSAANVASDVEVQQNLPNSTTPAWEEFARNVSGEWDGHGADFTKEGEPIELPENVVPDAYREWEVRVFDWVTQCPTLAESDKSALFYKLIHLLPTVGCEADAATRHTVDERHIGGVDNKVSAFAYNSSGCYVAVWPKENKGVSLLELEHCLVDPQNREVRVRIVQVVRIDGTALSLSKIKVFREQWYGPFRNGESLGGCSIRDAAFAKTDVIKGSEVMGTWKSSKCVASFQSSETNFFQELAGEKNQQSVRDEQNLVLLPKQLWCSFKETGNGETCAEVGWLLEQGRAITSRCILSEDAKLQGIAVGQEHAMLENSQ